MSKSKPVASKSGVAMIEVTLEIPEGYEYTNKGQACKTGDKISLTVPRALRLLDDGLLSEASAEEVARLK